MISSLLSDDCKLGQTNVESRGRGTPKRKTWERPDRNKLTKVQSEWAWSKEAGWGMILGVERKLEIKD